MLFVGQCCIEGGAAPDEDLKHLPVQVPLEEVQLASLSPDCPSAIKALTIASILKAVFSLSFDAVG